MAWRPGWLAGRHPPIESSEEGIVSCENQKEACGLAPGSVVAWPLRGDSGDGIKEY